MPTQPNHVDPLVVRKLNLLRIFYAAITGCAITFIGAHSSHSFWRIALLAVSVANSILALWTMGRFLRTIDEFEALYMYGALRFAFVGMLCLLVLETFLESLGFHRVPGYGNASAAVILWSLGLAITSWQRHWRRGYEE